MNRRFLVRYVSRIIYASGVCPPLFGVENWSKYSREQALRLLETLLGLDGILEITVMIMGGWTALSGENAQTSPV